MRDLRSKGLTIWSGKTKDQNTIATVSLDLTLEYGGEAALEEIKSHIRHHLALEASTLFEIISLLGAAISNEEIEVKHPEVYMLTLGKLGGAFTDAINELDSSFRGLREFKPVAKNKSSPVEDAHINLAREVNNEINSEGRSKDKYDAIIESFCSYLRDGGLYSNPELVKSLICSDPDHTLSAELSQIVSGEKALQDD